MLAVTFLQLNITQLIGGQPLERFPAALTLIYLGGVAFVVFILLMSLLTRRVRSPLAAEADENLPEEVRKRLGSRSANRALWFFRIVFAGLAFSVFGFHVYWSLYAAEKDADFAKLERRDIRNKRVAKAELGGWILDRSGNLNNAFAFWKIEKKTNDKGKVDEDLVREYPLDKEMAHVLGTEIGPPGLERTLFKRQDDTTPEALDVAVSKFTPKGENRDVRLTIDRELQRFAFEQLKDKRGAVVVLNPQTGEVLALASNPSYSLADAQDREKFRQLEDNQDQKPLISRAMREYYVPGSTFKTFTMIAAFRAGLQDATFTDTLGGYVPFPGSRPITDDNRSCENCGLLQMPLAYEFSSNQFFSWMAVQLGSNRMRDTAQRIGIEAVEDRKDALNRPFQSKIWNASNDEIKGAMALRQATIVAGKVGNGFTLYDLAIQGMGQGLAGQMTPFQMAMIAATAGNMNGNLMKPKIEFDRPPEVYNNVLTPQQAAAVREIMLRVTRGARGTAKNVGAIVGPDIPVGGKTGTAQKEVIKYDKNGKPETYIIKRRNRKTGEITEIVQTRKRKRIDGWFIAIAPINNPQVAIAVVVEDIGSRYGGGTAGPIAANVIVKSRQLGLLGEALRPKAAPTNPPNGPTTRRR